MEVIVHGGAGATPDAPEERAAVLAEAARVGAAEASVVRAVEAAVNVLEEAPRFGAGRGGAVQVDGVIRNDAGVMTGDREAGAVCSVPGVLHTVSLARVVMEETPHVLVSGQYAVHLAEAFGIDTGVDLWDRMTREAWEQTNPPATDDLLDQLAWVTKQFEADTGDEVSGGDTVGAVAQDGRRFAVATSTNGRNLALPGRVGDVPQIGSGFYASPAGAASATGAGEDIAKATLARRCVRHLETGLDAHRAATLAIEQFAELTGSTAGVIAVDRTGTTGTVYNTSAMQTAAARQ